MRQTRAPACSRHRAGQVGEGDEPGPRRDRAGERLLVVAGARMRVLLLDRHHRVAEALRLLAPGVEVARVIVGMDEDLVAGLQIEAVRDEVVRLTGVAGDDDLVRRRPQELGQGPARLLLLRIQPRPVVGGRIHVHAARLARQRLEHRPGRRAQVRGVHHRQVRRHDELLADALPERLAGRRTPGARAETPSPAGPRPDPRTAADPPSANSRVKSRRETDAAMRSLRIAAHCRQNPEPQGNPRTRTPNPEPRNLPDVVP